jgi:hypothetical protein
MPSFNYSDIFGSGVSIQVLDYTPLGLTIDTGDIMDEAHSGDLPDGLGLVDASSPTATQIFYGLLMLLKQNQGAKIDTDPMQKVYITDAGKTIATGSRDGQVKRSFTVSFFLDAGLAGIPAVGQIDQTL